MRRLFSIPNQAKEDRNGPLAQCQLRVNLYRQAQTWPCLGEPTHLPCPTPSADAHDAEPTTLLEVTQAY